jgi:hypothetical protein
MKYQLVLQFPGDQIEDFDQMLKLEFELNMSLGTEHIVDGHDFGAGEMNIFIHTNNPEDAYKKAKGTLNKLIEIEYIAAFRELEGANYTVLYPSDYMGAFCVK